MLYEDYENQDRLEAATKSRSSFQIRLGSLGKFVSLQLRGGL